MTSIPAIPINDVLKGAVVNNGDQVLLVAKRIDGQEINLIFFQEILPKTVVLLQRIGGQAAAIRIGHDPNETSARVIYPRDVTSLHVSVSMDKKLVTIGFEDKNGE